MGDDETCYVTKRGFSGYLDMIDTYGSTVQVQQSSAAFEARCWLRVTAPKDGPPGSLTSDGAGHLSVSQAKRVMAALREWVVWAEEQIAAGNYDE